MYENLNLDLILALKSKHAKDLNRLALPFKVMRLFSLNLLTIKVNTGREDGN